MKKLVLFLVIVLTLTSCFKTAEEIRREKMIDEQLSQSAKIIADLSGQVNDLKGNLATTSGQLEEIDHKSTQSNQTQYMALKQQVDQLTAQVKVLTEENSTSQKKIALLSQEVKAQKEFIKKVTGTLSNLGGDSSGTSLLKQAHTAFEKNKQKKAKALYLEVLQKGKINNRTKNHVYMNLGLLEYWSAKYDQALIYFSKIYTKYPKSSFAPRALLYIGRSFKKSNRPEEAKVTFEEVISNYPKTRQAKAAKKELKK